MLLQPNSSYFAKTNIARLKNSFCDIALTSKTKHISFNVLETLFGELWIMTASEEHEKAALLRRCIIIIIILLNAEQSINPSFLNHVTPVVDFEAKTI